MCSLAGSGEGDECCHSAYFLLFNQPSTEAHRMVPPTIKVDLPSLVTPVWELLQRQTQRCIYQLTIQMKHYSLHKLSALTDQGARSQLKTERDPQEWWTKVGFRCKRELYCTVFQPLGSSSGTFQRNCGVDAAPASPLFYREAADVKCQIGGFISPSIPANVSPPSSFSLVPQVALHTCGGSLYLCVISLLTLRWTIKEQ